MRCLKWLFLLAATMALLTGCHQPRNYEYYLSHPDALEKTFARCDQLSGPEAYADNDCVAAITAGQAIKAHLLKATSESQAFGIELLNLQTKYAQNQQALEDLQNASKQNESDETQKLISAKKEELQQMKDDLQARLTVIRLMRPHLQ